MWTIKSFQNKKSTRAVTAPLIPPVGHAKIVTSSEFSPLHAAFIDCNKLCLSDYRSFFDHPREQLSMPWKKFI